MENIYHEKEEEGVFYGSFSYLTEGMFSGSFEAKCSQACVNMLLQKTKFIEGLAVAMDDQALCQTIEALHIKSHFGIPELTEMENLFLLNWGAGQLEVFGSLLALYQVLKAEGLTLLPFSASLHPSIASATQQPQNARGYLFMLEDHWMVMRQMGKQWYKFDPWLTGVQLLSHFYVSLYIKQLLADGKLVFLVDGEFPPCPADVEVVAAEDSETLAESENTVTQDVQGKPSVDMSGVELQEGLRFLDLVFENEDNELALALLLSLEDDHRRKKESESDKILLATTLMSESSVAPQAHISSLQMMRKQGGDGTVDNPFCGDNAVDGDVREDPGSDLRLHRRNGTVLNPMLATTVHENLLNNSSDSDDLCGPFSLMFHEPGEGFRCLATPPTTGVCIASTSAVRSCPNPTPAPRSTPTQGTPKIFITTSDKCTFKVLAVSGKSDGGEIVSETEEEAMCCVCWASAPSHVVVPCGHFCLCGDCSLGVQQPPPAKSYCPLCKQETTSIIRLFK